MSDKETNKRLVKEMNFTQRLAHIWDYYKFVIIGVLFVIAVGIFLSLELLERDKTSVLNIATLNCTFARHDIQSMEEEFLNTASFSTKENCITFYDDLVATQDNAAKEQDPVGAFTGYNSLEAMLLNKEPIDILLSNVSDLTATHEGMEDEKGNRSHIVFEDYFIDITEILPEDILSNHQDAIVYSPNTGKAIGINMKESKLATKYGTFQMETILCVCEYMENKENVIAFLEYAFDE